MPVADISDFRLHPFGMLMPARTYTSKNLYRYGFNGKENDNEIKGEGNQQDYGMRIYDPRLGKFLSVDPLYKAYPWYTPYSYAGNKPIKFIDLDGAEEASLEERNRAIVYLENSLKPYVTQYAQSRAFVNISPEKFLKALTDATVNPSTLANHGETGNVCGIYAFSYLFSIYDPANFARGAVSLYITGQSEIGNLKIVPQGTLKRAKNVTNNLSAFVFGGSIRSHYNQFANYGNPNWGATDSKTMKAWITDRLGASLKEFEYGVEYWADGITSEDLTKLKDHINSGKQAVVRVNGDQYNERNPHKYALRGDVPGGDHWIVISGSMSIDQEKKTVSFTAFDMNDGYKEKTFSITMFKDLVNHVLLVEKKEDKHTK